MMAYAECEFFVPAAHSLKEKRAVLQSMTMRVKQKYNISIAEIDHQDVWQRTLLALVSVASSQQAAERELERAIAFLESNPEWQCLHIDREFI
ncbi:DUF503 domain-containing protein [Rummeliibacillus sp. G93]|uniref:DUF503 domain-containing protein n=1 Tax=Rummeliibacillus TaxID=648802 RepID=UPI0011693926|nr:MULTISPECIES: DUF503 domain-containing protein [Rummeliibacillus]MBB5169838.1 hypothetical protein [Rummeliibacillus stabekisii]MCM3315858.1 DUF503 domain-containing protein [Rummeliibacillus stabekisii]UQW98424.1 DUF503 domain-containing protein [Rummeliibacillus sp. G93]GEL04096.1 hypothetical protein RST01_07230 [Rummeliibacillus stabekisii]